jgi:hypothetical protein
MELYLARGATCMAMWFLKFEISIGWDTLSHIPLDFLFERLSGSSVPRNTGKNLYPFKQKQYWLVVVVVVIGLGVHL